MRPQGWTNPRGEVGPEFPVDGGGGDGDGGDGDGGDGDGGDDKHGMSMDVEFEC